MAVSTVELLSFAVKTSRNTPVETDCGVVPIPEHPLTQEVVPLILLILESRKLLHSAGAEKCKSQIHPDGTSAGFDPPNNGWIKNGKIASWPILMLSWSSVLARMSCRSAMSAMGLFNTS